MRLLIAILCMAISYAQTDETAVSENENPNYCKPGTADPQPKPEVASKLTAESSAPAALQNFARYIDRPENGRLCKAKYFTVGDGVGADRVEVWRVYDSNSPRRQYSGWWNLEKPTETREADYRAHKAVCSQFTPNPNRLVHCYLKPGTPIAVGFGQSTRCACDTQAAQTCTPAFYDQTSELQVFINTPRQPQDARTAEQIVVPDMFEGCTTETFSLTTGGATEGAVAVGNLLQSRLQLHYNQITSDCFSFNTVAFVALASMLGTYSAVTTCKRKKEHHYSATLLEEV